MIKYSLDNLNECLLEVDRKSGVYCYVDSNNKILYVGKSHNIARRLYEHRYFQLFMKEAKAVIVFLMLNPKCLEHKIIWRYDPPYNGIGATCWAREIPESFRKKVKYK